MRDCHSIVGLYTYQNRVPFAPSLRWVSCKERDRLPHEGANFHSSFVHYLVFQDSLNCLPFSCPLECLHCVIKRLDDYRCDVAFLDFGQEPEPAREWYSSLVWHCR